MEILCTISWNFFVGSKLFFKSKGTDSCKIKIFKLCKNYLVLYVVLVMQCKIITKITKLVDNNIMPDDTDNPKPEKKRKTNAKQYRYDDKIK